MFRDKFVILVSIVILLVILFLIYLSINLCYTWRDFFGTIIGSLFGLEGTLLVVQYSKNNTESQIQANKIIHNNESIISQNKMYQQNLFKYEDKLSDLNRSVGRIKANINLHFKKGTKLNDLIAPCNKWIVQLQSINSSKTMIFGELEYNLKHILSLRKRSQFTNNDVLNKLNKFGDYSRLWKVIINQTCSDMYVFTIRERAGEYSSERAPQVINNLSSEFNEFLNDLQNMVEKINQYISKI